jgi:hypothetical protein
MPALEGKRGVKEARVRFNGDGPVLWEPVFSRPKERKAYSRAKAEKGSPEQETEKIGRTQRGSPSDRSGQTDGVDNEKKGCDNQVHVLLQTPS